MTNMAVYSSFFFFLNFFPLAAATQQNYNHRCQNCHQKRNGWQWSATAAAAKTVATQPEKICSLHCTTFSPNAFILSSHFLHFTHTIFPHLQCVCVIAATLIEQIEAKWGKRIGARRRKEERKEEDNQIKSANESLQWVSESTVQKKSALARSNAAVVLDSAQ